MRNLQINRLLIIGWILFAIARIASHAFDEQANLLHAFNGFAIGIVIAGAIKQVFGSKLNKGFSLLNN
ncbi:MAG: hypothetical protein FWG77_02845 [Treponema sp.]|nr:hypothetical protein [Treponema sp.]